MVLINEIIQKKSKKYILLQTESLAVYKFNRIQNLDFRFCNQTLMKQKLHVHISVLEVAKLHQKIPRDLFRLIIPHKRDFKLAFSIYPYDIS